MNLANAAVMRSKKLRYVFLALILARFLFAGEAALCWDDLVNHPDMTKGSIAATGLDNYLVNNLGMSEGKDKTFTYYPSIFSITPVSSSILKMMMRGSTDEDHPWCRASNHFHDPLKTWNLSYLTDMTALARDPSVLLTIPIHEFCERTGWLFIYSDVTWATGYMSPPDAFSSPSGRLWQDRGWDSARNYYFIGLTSTLDTDRNDYLGRSFRALGQTVHLLQDMAVPAHVRNDFQGHINLMWKWPPSANLFEYFLELNPNLVKGLALDCVTVSRPGIVNPRVTDFWDTTNWRTGAWDPVNNQTVPGLAEFTNANYLSQSTIPINSPIPEHRYLWPRVNSPIDNNIYSTCLDNALGTNAPTYYVSRRPCESPGGVDHFAAVSLVTPKNSKTTPIKAAWLDWNVHKDYAKELVPKAMGYSAALIDHFFRGSIELQPDNTSTFRSVTVTARNATANGDAMTGGDLYLVVRYKEWQETDAGGGYRYLNFPGDYKYKVYHYPTQSGLPGAGETPIPLTFNLSADPIPLHAWDVSLQLVYKGTLGNESGAVAVGRVALATLNTDIGISLPASGIYANATDNAFRSFALTAQTDIAGLDLTDGLIELEVQYRVATSDPFLSRQVDTGPIDAKAYLIRVPEMSGVKTLPPGQPVELHFNLGTTPLPLWATDVYVNLIYRKESDPDETKWLGAGRRDISEPTPVDVFNNTDRVCINGTWYRNETPEYQAIALAAVDNNSDIYPHYFTNILGEISSVADNALASASRRDFIEPGPQLPDTLLTLGHILTDYSFSYSFLPTWNVMSADDHWPTGSVASALPGHAVKNQTEPDGSFTYPVMYMMRNNRMWWGTGLVYENPRYPTDSVCDWNAIP